MSDKSSRFRNALVGFRRSDVLSYLEQRAHEHNEQRNELARKLEGSQKQLKEVQERLAQAEKELQAVKAEAETKSSEFNKLNSELAELRATNEELRAKNTIVEQELSDIKAERDSLAADLETIKAQKEEIDQAKLHVAEIELEAYSRAKKIESNAIENANLARETLSDLILDVKNRFDKTRDNAAQTFHRMTLELDRLKEVLTHLPESFDSISSEIESLRFGNEKKNTVPEANNEEEGPGTEIPPSLNENNLPDNLEYNSIVYPVEDEYDDSSYITDSYTFPDDDEDRSPENNLDEEGLSERKQDTNELLFFRPQKTDE
jgi:chromosome segregation ATPase